MSVLKTSLAAAAVSAALTAGVLYLVQRHRNSEAAQLRQQYGQLLLTAQQRLASTDLASRDSQHNAPRSTESDARPIGPLRTYRNEGAGTAIAALQTFAWACDRGDTAAVKRLLVFDPDARAKVQLYFKSLPAGTQARFGTLEDLAATVMVSATMHNPLPSAQVLDLATGEPLSDNRVRVDVPGTGIRGLVFEDTEGVWKRVITAAMVDRYLAQTRTAN